MFGSSESQLITDKEIRETTEPGSIGLPQEFEVAGHQMFELDTLSMKLLPPVESNRRTSSP